MSPENKQRVVGVIVLVAFIALLIPFLFTSGLKKKDQADSGSEAVASIPVNEVSAPPPSVEVTASNLPPPIVATTTTPAKELPNELLKDGIDANAVADLPVTITEGVTGNMPEAIAKVAPESNVIPEVDKSKEPAKVALESNAIPEVDKSKEPP